MNLDGPLLAHVGGAVRPMWWTSSTG